MRRASVLFALLVAGTVLAAPVPLAPPAPTPESQQFATQLLAVAQQIHEDYVLLVPVADLLHAAAAGLYEEARLRVPPDLKERLAQAAAKNTLVLVLQQAYLETTPDPAKRNPLPIAVRAMFRQLDPYSGVLSADEQRRNVALEQEAGGVGVVLHEYSGVGPLVVKTVYPGGPAQRAGLRPGDHIMRINDTVIAPTGEKRSEEVPHTARLQQVRSLLESADVEVGLASPVAPPARLTVTFRRPGGLVRSVEIDRGKFHVETVLGVTREEGHRWDYWVDVKKKIAHVRVSVLAKGTSEELLEVLTRLKDNGMCGLVLDLRWTPGGYLDEATAIPALFLGDVPVATVRSRKEEAETYRGSAACRFPDLPLVVLVNGETSGGAELIAAAIQDHKRAFIVGQRTLGKGSVQRPMQLNVPGVQMKMTTGSFFRPNGKNLHRFPDSKPGDDWGVRPNVEFRISADLQRALKEWWQSQTLRPGWSMERLPLDDPVNDGPRNAAVDVLLRMLEKKPETKRNE